MKHNQIKARLKVALPLIREAEAIAKVLPQARMLVDEADVHEIQTLALELASRISTIESILSQYTRFGFSNKKFVIVAETN